MHISYFLGSAECTLGDGASREAPRRRAPSPVRTVYADGFGLWIGDSQEVTATGVVEGTGATSGTATVSVDDNNNIVVTLDSFVYSGSGRTTDGYSKSAITYTGTSGLVVNLVGSNWIAQTGNSIYQGDSFGLYSSSRTFF